MKRPRFGESNLSALIGAIVGSVGGLFAVGLVPAIHTRDVAQFVATPVVSFVGWIIGGIVGWITGGQIGPRFETRLGERKANLLGGILGGLIPILSIAAWSWHMTVGR